MDGFNAFLAHRDAYEKCGILHRDVSGNNVMMKDDGGGILNDWDQARKVVDMVNGPRQWSRSVRQVSLFAAYRSNFNFSCK